MNYTTLLLEALGSEYGLSILTPSPELLRSKLYPLRKEDPDFECLSFVIPEPGRLYIVKRPSDATSKSNTESS